MSKPKGHQCRVSISREHPKTREKQSILYFDPDSFWEGEQVAKHVSLFWCRWMWHSVRQQCVVLLIVHLRISVDILHKLINTPTTPRPAHSTQQLTPSTTSAQQPPSTVSYPLPKKTTGPRCPLANPYPPFHRQRKCSCTRRIRSRLGKCM